ncbi:MAG: DUF1801 domain-containing protein [Thermoplasmata archaeon]|nr:DUF1801 domain-containing protein [Thermoplasmata archaeon]
MPENKRAAKPAQKAARGFTDEEKAAMREAVREYRSGPKARKENGESDILAKISEMTASDRAMAERLHALVKAHAPSLTPRTWYGMPAYSKDDQVLVYFKAASKFKERYAMLGFSDEANLDDGHMWPVAYALTEMTKADEAKIAALLKRAVG